MTWQPIRQMPLIAGLIDGALEDTREHLATLSQAQARPHGLDDATLDRVQRVHDEQLEYVAIYEQQIRRWRAEGLSAEQRRELDRMEAQNRELRAVTDRVLALSRELRAGTIDRIAGMSDLELGLRALLGDRSGSRR